MGTKYSCEGIIYNHFNNDQDSIRRKKKTLEEDKEKEHQAAENELPLPTFLLREAGTERTLK